MGDVTGPGTTHGGAARRAARVASCALLATCALLASCAGAGLTSPAAPDFRPALRTSLVPGRDVTFLVAQQRRGAESTTVLARAQAGAPPHHVARLVQVRQGQALHVSVQRLPEPADSAGGADLEIAALSQLYALVLRQEPLARYCLGGGGQPCDPARDGVSHAEVLQALADARERAAGAAAVPWRVVELKATPPRLWDADFVGVRATSTDGPLEGVAVYFNRAPHSGCMARTRVDGVAVCRLVDPHGDEHEHDHTAPVVATFPGDVRTDRVLLPTTHVLPASPYAVRNALSGKP